MRKTVSLLALLLALGAIILWQYGADVRAHFNQIRASEAEAPPPSAGYVNVSIADFSKLDFLPKSAVLERRRKAVEGRPDLRKRFYRWDYEPSGSVFGQIIDGKPWWGLEGLCYYGDGENANKGPSRESLFIDNPYLLVGLSEAYAYRVAQSKPWLEPASIYPSLEELGYSKGHAWARARYNVTRYLRKARAYGYFDNSPPTLGIHCYNARDLGLPWIAVDSASSSGVRPASPDQPIEIPQYIHCGNSCGIPGGCNNMSPTTPSLQLTLEDLPARIVYRLWNERPESAKAAPAFWFVIDME